MFHRDTQRTACPLFTHLVQERADTPLQEWNRRHLGQAAVKLGGEGFAVHAPCELQPAHERVLIVIGPLQHAG
jgi:hypothetical protein